MINKKVQWVQSKNAKMPRSTKDNFCIQRKDLRNCKKKTIGKLILGIKLCSDITCMSSEMHSVHMAHCFIQSFTNSQNVITTRHRKIKSEMFLKLHKLFHK